MLQLFTLVKIQTMPSIPTNKTKIPCPTPNCNGFVRARGFCVNCYYRHLRNGVIKKGSATTKFRHRISNVDTQSKMGDCTCCGRVKVIKRDEKRYRCSIPSNEKAKMYKQAYRQSRKIMLKNHCEICGNQSKLCYDHCHESGEFRGTLCNKCNSAIGLFNDSILTLKSAISYLTKKT
jgi:hypothetical protein